MATLKPLHDFIVIEPDEVKETTASGIFTGSKDEAAKFGTVLAVGPGKVLNSGERVPPTVKPGDRVAFQKAAMTGVQKFEGKDIFFTNEANLHGVIVD